jgi:DNA polymerase III alpha subunit
MSFAVNKRGQIRFGLTGVKGVGDKAVESIIEERNERARTNLFMILPSAIKCAQCKP